jgi:uncharacterized protein YecT (DUF1311 family)
METYKERKERLIESQRTWLKKKEALERDIAKITQQLERTEGAIQECLYWEHMTAEATTTTMDVVTDEVN